MLQQEPVNHYATLPKAIWYQENSRKAVVWRNSLILGRNQ